MDPSANCGTNGAISRDPNQHMVWGLLNVLRSSRMPVNGLTRKYRISESPLLLHIKSALFVDDYDGV